MNGRQHAHCLLCLFCGAGNQIPQKFLRIFLINQCRGEKCVWELTFFDRVWTFIPQHGNLLQRITMFLSISDIFIAEILLRLHEYASCTSIGHLRDLIVLVLKTAALSVLYIHEIQIYCEALCQGKTAILFEEEPSSDETDLLQLAEKVYST